MPTADLRSTRRRAPIRSRTPGRPAIPGAVVRTATGGDRPVIERMLERCSAENLHHRWASTSHPVPQHYPDRYPARARGTLSLVCELPGLPGEIVALADATRVGTHAVEVAVLVEDRHHRRGIGSLLVDELISRSARTGAARVHVHSDRPWVLGRLRSYGPVTVEIGRGEHAASVELTAPSPTRDRTPSGTARVAQEAAAQ